MELVKDTTKDDLRRMCKSILNDVCDGILITEENIEEWAVEEIPDIVVVGEYLPTHEWISRNVYSERYLIDSDGELIEVQLMVAGVVRRSGFIVRPTLWKFMGIGAGTM